MALDLIGDLVALLEERWNAVHFQEEAFPAIAARTLEEVALHEHVTLNQIVDSIVSEPDEATRKHLHPAHSVITLHAGARFQIFAHVWLDDVGHPHSHSWSGAYQVVSGPSFYTLFKFEETARIRSKLHLGKTTSYSMGYLRPGDVFTITPGRQLIHGLGYAERPSLSVSVRSTEYHEMGMDYRRPGVAIESALPESGVRSILRCLSLLAGFDSTELGTQFEKLVRRSDLLTIFYALRTARLRSWELDEGVWDAARETHGTHFDIVKESIDDFSRQMEAVRLRKLISDPDIRFFLAAIYLASDWDEVRRFVELRRPGSEPEHLVALWLMKLLVGPQDVDEEETTSQPMLRALNRVLYGSGVDDMIDTLRGDPDVDDVDSKTDLLKKAHLAMRESLLLRTLFAGR